MLLIILSIILGAAGQIFLKLAADGCAEHTSNLDFYLSLAANHNTWLGALTYGLSFMLWLKVLARFELSYARPLVGLSYVIVAALSLIVLGERPSALRWLGIGLVTAGVIVIGLEGGA
ncbi:MAG: 4-amino-4-deoxy-L-arabinose-phosphoundecaprenol flippase subunit ArnF [Deltaproteobacteria bacterium ADurb.Bin510]|jgi:uncharacterized membrane protein|nr:MAG: 4-amino-4-deoxy-L-arabinose-phosphoundecaprenol flippase subunit ArnF [Deltaproteobacteria bacterium ADurb.Bin510]